PGDVHDSVPYLDHLEQIHRDVLPIQAATADAAYDIPLAHRVLEEQGISFYVRPHPFADRTKVEFKRDAFSYDEEKDVYQCPNTPSTHRWRCGTAPSREVLSHWGID
ncbi:transposase, partial [Intestinimonas massiliensis]|nr:transposase [Intestinimonas massiliensis (ex Afouda et al. 2020)]